MGCCRRTRFIFQHESQATPCNSICSALRRFLPFGCGPQVQVGPLAQALSQGQSLGSSTLTNSGLQAAKPNSSALASQ